MKMKYRIEYIRKNILKVKKKIKKKIRLYGR